MALFILDNLYCVENSGVKSKSSGSFDPDEYEILLNDPKINAALFFNNLNKTKYESSLDDEIGECEGCFTPIHETCSPDCPYMKMWLSGVNL